MKESFEILLILLIKLKFIFLYQTEKLGSQNTALRGGQFHAYIGDQQYCFFKFIYQTEYSIAFDLVSIPIIVL